MEIRPETCRQNLLTDSNMKTVTSHHNNSPLNLNCKGNYIIQTKQRDSCLRDVVDSTFKQLKGVRHL